MLDSLIADPERGLFCINYDEEEQLEIMGDFQDDNELSVDILFLPCNYVHN